jgi:hypothetical protein
MSTPETPKRKGGVALMIIGIILIVVGALSSNGIQRSAGDDIAMATSLILTLVCLIAGIVMFVLGLRIRTRRD